MLALWWFWPFPVLLPSSLISFILYSPRPSPSPPLLPRRWVELQHVKRAKGASEQVMYHLEKIKRKERCVLECFLVPLQGACRKCYERHAHSSILCVTIAATGGPSRSVAPAAARSPAPPRRALSGTATPAPPSSPNPRPVRSTGGAAGIPLLPQPPPRRRQQTAGSNAQCTFQVLSLRIPPEPSCPKVLVCDTDAGLHRGQGPTFFLSCVWSCVHFTCLFPILTIVRPLPRHALLTTREPRSSSAAPAGSSGSASGAAGSAQPQPAPPRSGLPDRDPNSQRTVSLSVIVQCPRVTT